MNKSELVDLIAARQDVPRKRAEEVVELVFDMMVDALRQNDRIEVRGFGSFVVKNYGAYQGRNPRSGAPINVRAKRMPFFKVGKELRARVDHGHTKPGSADGTSPKHGPSAAPPAHSPSAPLPGAERAGLLK
jgi:integration host factor subunit beta